MSWPELMIDHLVKGVTGSGSTGASNSPMLPTWPEGVDRDHPFLGSLRDCHLKKSISECRLFSEKEFYSQWPLHPKSSTYNLISFLSSMCYKIDNYSKASTWLRSLSSIFKNCSRTEEPLLGDLQCDLNSKSI